MTTPAVKVIIGNTNLSKEDLRVAKAAILTTVKALVPNKNKSKNKSKSSTNTTNSPNSQNTKKRPKMCRNDFISIVDNEKKFFLALKVIRKS